MATSIYYKVNDFVDQLCRGVHDFSGDTFKIGLTNIDPTSAATDFNALTEITAQNGYVAGGTALTGVTLVETAGVVTFDANNVVFTAAGGSFGPFQYCVLMNATPSAGGLVYPIVGYFDYAAALTLNDTETFTVNVTTNIFTMS
jgi:hypothetical protein